MADKGAKYLILLSRSGPASLKAKEVIAELEEQGVQIFAPQCDVTSKASLEAVLEVCGKTMPPIRGCINAVMHLQVPMPNPIPWVLVFL